MKMKKTLYWKFIAVYLLFGLFGFVSIATLTSALTLKHLTKEKADALYKEATLVAGSYAKEIYKGEITVEAAKSQLKAIDTYISAPIWIIDNSGKVILNSREEIPVDNPVIIEDFNPASSGKYYMTGNFYGKFSEETLSVFSPITSKFKVNGYVVIHASMNSIKKSRDQILNISYITMAIIFLLSLLILIVFTEFVYIPLRKITTATEEYAKGNMDYKLEIERNDEMGYLAGTLNYMASEIARSEDNQKKFIANVSHDFRSPLTSIKGYLEAMIDGTIPPEMSEKYLNIVLNETDRLAKLTNSLLQLNNLNVKGILLDKSDFDINGIIKKTAETFEGTCTAKRISIELVLTGETLYVLADMSKIQQVLYNLLDNAIKFSHHDSVIKIETTEKNEKVFVSVKDSGIGIPKDSIKLVFDRFYKTDLSRGKDKKGTGLGLAITKEIIQAHNENINVISTEGVGSEFIFTLTKSKQYD